MPWYLPAGLLLVIVAVAVGCELFVRRSERWQRRRQRRMRDADERVLMDYYKAGLDSPDEARYDRTIRRDVRLDGGFPPRIQRRHNGHNRR